MLRAMGSCRVGTRRLTWLLPLATACAIQAYAAPSRAELPPAPAAEVQPSAEAREQFQLGVSLLQDPDGARYEDAFKAFYRAYELTPSWKILGNLGLSAMKLERYTDGIEAYERYLAESGSNLDPAERRQIEKDLSIMRGTTGHVTLLVSGTSEVSLEDTRLRAVGGPIVNTYAVPAGGRIGLRLAAGKHSLVASGGGRSASLELTVKAGESVEKTLELGGTSAPPLAVSSASEPTSNAEPAQGSSSTLRTTGLIVGGVGVAALVGGGIAGFLGLGKKGE